MKSTFWSLVVFAIISAWCNTLYAQPREQVLATAQGYMKVLTAPDFHGRGYVRGGDALAAEWISEQYARIGLEPMKSGYFQPFSFPVNTFPDTIVVKLDGKRARSGVDFILDPESPSAKGDFEVVHLTLESVIRNGQGVVDLLKGKAACLWLNDTKDADTLLLQAQCKRLLMGACPLILPTEGKLTWSVAQEVAPFPMIQLKASEITQITDRIVLDIKNTFIIKHEANNVIGSIKGRTDQWIIVSAHYDHLGEMGPDALFPGANDNASGVSMLLSLAEWFKQDPPKHNMLFIAFAGEEAGLVGSKWCAAHSPIPLDKVKLMMNLDILGTGDDGITVVNATAQPKIYKKLVSINKKKKLLPQVKQRGPACNSDHCPFVQLGVPGIFIYTLGGIAAYHDVFDKNGTLPLTKYPEVYALLKQFLIRTK